MTVTQNQTTTQQSEMIETRREANRRHHRGVESACALYRKDVIDPRRKLTKEYIREHLEEVKRA